MGKRYQIFISSTFTDLQDERNKVMQAVLERKCFPAGMEFFPATDRKQLDYIKQVIKDSDYYLIIIGARYGSIDSEGVSYTEREYNYAKKEKIPIIAFIHNNIEAIPLGKADVNEDLQLKLEKFRKKVAKGRLVQYWENALDLKSKVTSSLVDAFNEIEREGWIRGNIVENNDVSTNTIRELNTTLTKKNQEISELKRKNRAANRMIKTLESKLEKLFILENSNLEIHVNETVSFKMIRVKGGTFRMGATPEQTEDAWEMEKPDHDVTLDDYWIGETLVTQALWEAVMGKDENHSHFKDDLNLPADSVSWHDCRRFIRKLNKLTQKEFDLPTEAEWEYAARGGDKHREDKYYKYSGSDDINDVALINHKKTYIVASLEPNELKIYDMSGNVWEWCLDKYGPYESNPQKNPTGPEKGTTRVLRGGAFDSYEVYHRVSNRFNLSPDLRFEYIGFRLVLRS